jgi:hypothetical protein
MPIEIGDVVELVAQVELDSIVVHEERGRRLHWTEDELQDRKFPLTVSSMGIGVEEMLYRFRFRTRFTDESGEYVADFEAVYGVPEAVDVSQEILSEFATRVAFMTVYPFLRASIFATASRLGLPIPVLGLVRQGEFEVGQPMSPEQVHEEFKDNRSESIPRDSDG